MYKTNPPPPKRTAFFISDGTAITAETLGRSLLSQFDIDSFDIKIIPYVDNLEFAHKVATQINTAHHQSGLKPLVFDTIVDDEIREIINTATACNLDIYEGLISRISDEIGVKPNPHAGVAHGDVNSETYQTRIAAVDFALANDDGGKVRHYDMADIILVGASRSGKTPTSLYLALQFGIRAANYPLTEEDLNLRGENPNTDLPNALKPYKNKLFGLTLDTERLVKIREERIAGSRYASFAQCQAELDTIANLYNKHNIPHLNVSEMSIEEIATRILQITGINRRIG